MCAMPKRTFTALLCLGFLFAFLPCAGASATESGFTPAKELLEPDGRSIIFNEMAIGDALADEEDVQKRADGSFTIRSLREVTSLTLYSNSAHAMDLSELQFFSQLEDLTIEGAMELTSVEALKTCPQLDSLSLTNIQRVDFGALAAVTPKLTYLSISGCRVEEATGFGKWKKLETIALKGDGLTDLSFLKNCKALTDLTLDETHNADLSTCAGLPKLEGLTVYSTQAMLQPAAWTLIKSCPKLSHLCLGDIFPESTFPLDKKAISGLKSLQTLILHGAEIDDLEFLSGLAQLDRLQIENCTMGHSVSLTPLAQCKKLTDIAINQSPIADFSGLSKLTKLYCVSICHSGLKDLSFVQGLSLEFLWVNGNEITDLAPLAKAKKIVRLSVSDNPIEAYQPLTKIKKLAYLQYNGTETLPTLKNCEVERGNEDMVFKKVIYLLQNGYFK